MGITAVPVIIKDEQFPMMGAPEPATLQAAFKELIDGSGNLAGKL